MYETQVVAAVTGVFKVPGEQAKAAEREGLEALSAQPTRDQATTNVVLTLGAEFVPCEGGVEHQGGRVGLVWTAL
jgi:hypothetical protein